MLISRSRYAVALLFAASATLAQLAKDVVRIQSAEVALEHVRVIDGTGAPAKSDIVLVRGDPSTNIRDIENVEIVFKDGVGYDSKK